MDGLVTCGEASPVMRHALSRSWHARHARKRISVTSVLVTKCGDELDVDYRQGLRECAIPRELAFHAGCAIRPWTALLAAKMLMLKGLSLQDPIGDLLPALRTSLTGVGSLPIETILTSSTGIVQNSYPIQCRAEFIASCANLEVPKTRAFSSWPAGYALIGAAIESLCDMSWLSLLHEMIFRPLRLSPRKAAESADNKGGLYDPPTDSTEYREAATSSLSFAPMDLVGFVNLFQSAEPASARNFVNDEVRKKMTTPSTRWVVGVDGFASTLGMGFFRERYCGFSGKYAGHCMKVFFNPNSKAAVIFCATDITTNLFSIDQDLLDLLEKLEEGLGVE